MAIVLEHVRKAFGDHLVLSDASFRVENGARVCFFGPSGCGKTTLMRLICGLDAPDAGRISLPEKARLACHFQEDRLLPWYTAAQNLALVVGEAAGAWLTRIGLPDAAGLYPAELSGGMRRRVSMARALGHKSDILLLDEPLRELDAATAEAMLRLIDESLGSRTLLLVTHDRAQAEALGCKVLMLPM